MKLKTYNITYRPDESNRYKTKTITYQANSIKEAEALFHAEHPEYKTNKQHYLEIHSPLSNYAIDDENEKIAEIQTDNTTTTTTSTTTTMKKFNILNTFKIVNEYVYHITMLIVGLIPLLLLGVLLPLPLFISKNVLLLAVLAAVLAVLVRADELQKIVCEE